MPIRNRECGEGVAVVRGVPEMPPAARNPAGNGVRGTGASSRREAGDRLRITRTVPGRTPAEPHGGGFAVSDGCVGDDSGATQVVLRCGVAPCHETVGAWSAVAVRKTGACI
jgi:hypothetical protein